MFLLCKHDAPEDVAAEKLSGMSAVEATSLRPNSFFRERAMRSSMGLRPANPSSVPCQCVMEGSPIFQQSSTMRPSTSQGKSSRPISMILHLHADGIDFGESVFGSLFSFGALGLAPRDRDNVDMRATVEEDAVTERLHFALDFFHQLLAVDGSAQQRLEYRQQRLGLVESESAVRHDGYLYSNAIGKAAGGN